MSPGVTPGDAAPSGRRGDGVGTSTGAPVAADDDTRPHTFGADDALDESQQDEPQVPLAKDEHSNGWSDERRDTMQMEPVAARSPYAGASAYGSLGPPGGNPYSATGMHQAPSAAPAAAPAAPRGGMARRARLKIPHLGPRSVFRISLTFAICMFIVLLVAVAALWAVLDTSGVFKSIEDAANTLVDKNRSSVADWLGFGRVMLITVVIGAANVIAFTLLSTIGALLYNLCSDFVGGVEVTLVER